MPLSGCPFRPSSLGHGVVAKRCLSLRPMLLWSSGSGGQPDSPSARSLDQLNINMLFQDLLHHSFDYPSCSASWSLRRGVNGHFFEKSTALGSLARVFASSSAGASPSSRMSSPSAPRVVDLSDPCGKPYHSRVQPTREDHYPLSCHPGNACGGPASSCARYPPRILVWILLLSTASITMPQGIDLSVRTVISGTHLCNLCVEHKMACTHVLRDRPDDPTG